MMDEPTAPGLGLPVYKPATVVVDGTCIEPPHARCRAAPYYLRRRLRLHHPPLPEQHHRVRHPDPLTRQARPMTPEERYEDLVDDFAGVDGVTPPMGGSGFGRGALRYRRKIFAMFVRGRLV